MATEPKPGSAAYFWIEHVAELQAILDPEDPRYEQVFNLLYAQDLELTVTAIFCSNEPGNPAPLTLQDVIDGNHIAKYRTASRQAAFNRMCQEVV